MSQKKGNSRSSKKKKGVSVQRLQGGNQTHSLMVNPTQFSLVPYAYRTWASFVETWDNTTAIPGFYDWVIRGNSIYDPDYALSADSVYGLDAMAGLYLYYKVIASKVTVTVTNNDADDPVNIVIVPTMFSNSFAAGNEDGVSAHPLSKSLTVAAANGARTLKHYYESAVLFDVKDLDSVNFRSEMTTNPATCWYWHVVTYNNAGTASDCEMRVRVDYDVEFSTPAAYTQ